MYKQYNVSADNSQFWSQHWKKEDLNEALERARTGEIISIIKKYIPQKSRILEAGCGQGIFVEAFREAGFKIEGLDFDNETIATARKIFPLSSFTVGDVFKLPHAEKYFDAYLSLGVIEHYEKNWHKPLKEANRVLKEGGLAFISVPYYNIWRKTTLPIKDALSGNKNRGNFYQYLFERKEIVRAIAAEGFSVKSVEFYGKSKTVMSMPFIGRIAKNKYPTIRKKINTAHQTEKKTPTSPLVYLTNKIFKILPNSVFAHMIMIIAQKK